MTHLAHLAARIFNAPLLIHRPKLDAILAVLGPRIGWTETLEARLRPLAVRAPRAATPGPLPGIAVIPIHGTLVRRTLGLEAESGLTSYEAITAALGSALASPDIAGILLDIDSPGGEAAGVFDLADRIAAARAVKPVWAVANEMAFSAAYALASGASKVWVTRMGGVGSIGVLAMHVDQSARDAKEGYRYTAVFAGERKNDLNPHEPLTSEGLAFLRSEVERIYGQFVATVAKHRGLDAEAVRDTEAALYFGGDAVQAGLGDAVGTFDEALSAFAEHLLPRPAAISAGMTMKRSRTHEEIPMSKKPDDVKVETPLPEAESDPPVSAPSAGPDPAAPPIDLAAQNAQANALAIAELCALAGCTHRIAEFLAKDTAPDAVRRELLAARASAPEVHSRILPEAGTGRPTSLDDNPVVRAAKARAATQRKEI
ncbi:MAG: S49 family peptidase [Candidatus Rokuibacteriota bacterium]